MTVSLHDPTSWVYITSTVISLYGTVLFLWWWRKNGRASSVFAYVTLIFLGELVESSLSMYARYLRLDVDQGQYIAFMAGGFWPGRKIITIIALAAITIHMSIRAFIRTDRELGRRRED